jgi:hypothetical protein
MPEFNINIHGLLPPNHYYSKGEIIRATDLPLQGPLRLLGYRARYVCKLFIPRRATGQRRRSSLTKINEVMLAFINGRNVRNLW